MASPLVWSAFPITTWSMVSGGTLDRSSAALEATTARSIAETSLSAPPGLPFPARPPTHSVIGVLAPFRITTSSRAIVGYSLSLSALSVFVEAAARFSPHVPREHHPFQERRRGELGLAELLEHDVGDVVGRVKADEVEQRQRPHGVAAAQLHAVVDIFPRGESR